MAERISWPEVVARAADIVNSYDTAVTLRQLYYRLVSEELLPNKDTSYKTLSARTAEARRDGSFPRLMDRTRNIHRPTHFDSAAHALDALARQYRLDRTEGQDHQVFLGVEKNGLVEQVTAWFRDRGIPVLALGGYSSQGYIDDVLDELAVDGRPAVLLYAGDFDATGVDILRDLEERTDGFFEVVERVALNVDQIEEYGLPPLPGKATDTRAAGFVATYGSLIQVEVDALDPNTLHDLFEDAIAPYWDVSTFDSVLEREADDLSRLRVAAGATS